MVPGDKFKVDRTELDVLKALGQSPDLLLKLSPNDFEFIFHTNTEVGRMLVVDLRFSLPLSLSRSSPTCDRVTLSRPPEHPFPQTGSFKP